MSVKRKERPRRISCFYCCIAYPRENTDARNMGKKGSWFSAIKKVFSSSSKEKPNDGTDKKSSKEKKKGRGKLKHGENRSLIPLFREPSSIEKILGEADELFIRPTTSSEIPRTPPALPVRPVSPRVSSPKAASPRVTSPRAASPKVSSPRAPSQRVASPRPAPPRAASPRGASPVVPQIRRETNYVYRPEPTSKNLHLAATKIQAAYRGYMARRSFRALRGLVRLQGVVRGQNVKRQTMNAMKQMQLLVRVQTQIQSRRIQMLENQAMQRQSCKNDKEAESTLSKWTLNQSEAGNNEDWDDSLLTKEEVEARLRKKVEAVIKRERAMAYAYSHQLWKANPRSSQAALDIRSNGFPWWWNWLERQLPPANPSENQSVAKNVHLTPPRPISEYKRSPRPQASNYKHHNYAFDNHESATPRSSKSAVPGRGKQFHTPTRTPPPNSSGLMKYTRPRASAAESPFDLPMNDTDSLTSCPPFSVPNYMVPTVSAKAKVRASSNPKERLPGTPGNDSKRRFSFPLTPNIGSFKWNKASSKEATSQKVLEKHESMRSIGDVSVESTVSMPAIVGRKPFNRFV
ncbi:unnamed protein product [Coffea canephora]|uniref:DUF4005 domain-containing protein n=1 Tax=Coffea canephora TaxID=49390 RepID=A0A068UQQ1_COFCA|nr:unnamed protein product [Coffea canephora]